MAFNGGFGGHVVVVGDCGTSLDPWLVMGPAIVFFVDVIVIYIYLMISWFSDHALNQAADPRLI